LGTISINGLIRTLSITARVTLGCVIVMLNVASLCLGADTSTTKHAHVPALYSRFNIVVFKNYLWSATVLTWVIISNRSDADEKTKNLQKIKKAANKKKEFLIISLK
jgi:hypothetical protein